MSRSDGIPSYVSKEQLFSALTRIMKKPSVLSDKKVEAVDLSGQKANSLIWKFRITLKKFCKIDTILESDLNIL